MIGHRIAGGERVSVQEVRELSKLPWVHDDALSDRQSEARLLPDGRLLLYFGEGEKGTLYPSREALEQVQRENVGEYARPLARMRALLPPVADFLRDVEVHATSLGGRIGVPDSVLDRTEESLDAVDEGLLQLKPARRMKPELVTALVAYVGLVLIRAGDGHWTRTYPRGVTVVVDGPEPRLAVRDGRIFMPFDIVTAELDHGEWGSLRRAVADVLRPDRR